MVVKLEGKVNGQIIIFQRKEGDWWETIIPPNLSGSYIVELVATDEAGNQGFATRYILTVDLDALCVHLSPLPYQAELEQPAYAAEVSVSDFYSEVRCPDIYSAVLVSDFYADFVRKKKCEGSGYDGCYG